MNSPFFGEVQYINPSKLYLNEVIIDLERFTRPQLIGTNSTSVMVVAERREQDDNNIIDWHQNVNDVDFQILTGVPGVFMSMFEEYFSAKFSRTND